MIAELLELGTATLYEASGIDCDLDPAIRAAWPGAAACGRALTVRTGPEDNLAIHLALLQAAPGDVLVVDAHALPCGYWGEVLAVAAQAKGVAGLVIDGGVRDVNRLAAIGFPAFARFVSVRRTAKTVSGEIGEPVLVGGRQVASGDMVIADADGVVVLPAALVDATTAAGEARVAKEDGWMEQLRAGRTTIDLLGLRHV
jgi:4-hydroxy-4-methyl-2-oxoglutarate aldolase